MALNADGKLDAGVVAAWLNVESLKLDSKLLRTSPQWVMGQPTRFPSESWGGIQCQKHLTQHFITHQCRGVVFAKGSV